MSSGGPNPGIWGESVRKALNSDQDQVAQEHQASGERALLDAEELRDLERSSLYGETRQSREPSRRRSLLDRLLRRSS
jgi:hypothetical protein